MAKRDAEGEETGETHVTRRDATGDSTKGWAQRDAQGKMIPIVSARGGKQTTGTKKLAAGAGAAKLDAEGLEAHLAKNKKQALTKKQIDRKGTSSKKTVAPEAPGEGYKKVKAEIAQHDKELERERVARG